LLSARSIFAGNNISYGLSARYKIPCPVSRFAWRSKKKCNAKARMSAAIPERSLQALEQQIARRAVFNAAAP
jgi:hypothetical protein